MRESLGVTKPKGEVRAKAGLASAHEVGSHVLRGWAHHQPVSFAATLRRSESVHVGTRKMVNYA